MTVDGSRKEALGWYDAMQRASCMPVHGTDGDKCQTVSEYHDSRKVAEVSW